MAKAEKKENNTEKLKKLIQVNKEVTKKKIDNLPPPPTDEIKKESTDKQCRIFNINFYFGISKNTSGQGNTGGDNPTNKQGDGGGDNPTNRQGDDNPPTGNGDGHGGSSGTSGQGDNSLFNLSHLKEVNINFYF